MTNLSKSCEFDVIVVGAGPVGLFLACELAMTGCKVLILEKSTSPTSTLKQIPFGIRGLSAPTIEALDRRGLLQTLEIHKRIKNPHAKPASHVQLKHQVGHFAGLALFEENIDRSLWSQRIPSSTPTSLISEIQELEATLTQRLVEYEVEIRRDCTVSQVHQSRDGVEVVVQNQEGEFKLASKWLVGCDGSRSAVRKACGFEFAGTEPEFTGYTTHLTLLDSTKLKAGRNPMPSGMYMQSQPGFIMLQDFDGGAFHDSRQPLTLDHIQTLLRRISEIDVTVSALHTATTWTDRARQATQYRQWRVLLAGDAAHIHSPLGGQGLNLGIGDAMNLGWKLAALIHNHASQELLDTYHDERHPIGERVLAWSRAQVAIMRPDPAARALHAILQDLINTKDGATYFAERIWGVMSKYDSESSHPLVGMSAPNFKFENGMTLADLLLAGRGLLIDFQHDPILQKRIESRAGAPTYFSSRAQDDLHLSCLLIRPDGIVAWAIDSTPDSLHMSESNFNDLTRSMLRYFGQ